VTNSSSETISQYSRDTGTGKLTALSPATVATGTNPIGICISADRASVYVANFGAATISQYSRDTGTGTLTAIGAFFLSKLSDSSAIPESTLKGILIEAGRTNISKYTRDLTNAAWVNTNCTSIKNITGIDGVSSSCARLTATGSDATAWQTVTLASSVRVFQPYIKRITGTGEIRITLDNSHWTEITSQINSSTWTRISITQTVTNPVFGFKIADSGDVIAVDFADCQDGVFPSSPISTTSAAVTRSADVLSYSATNIDTNAGTVKLDFTPEHLPVGTIFLFGSYVDADNYTAILHDSSNLIARKRIGGTNYDATIANAFTTGTTYRLAMSWGGNGINIALNGALGTAHSNSTAAQLGATLQLGSDGNGASQCFGEIKNVKFYKTELKTAKLRALT